MSYERITRVNEARGAEDRPVYLVGLSCGHRTLRYSPPTAGQVDTAGRAVLWCPKCSPRRRSPPTHRPYRDLPSLLAAVALLSRRP